jgi:hypothetical protein
MPSPIIDSASATVTAAGTVTFLFETTIRTNQTFMGSVTVPGAQSNSVNPIMWTAYDNSAGMALSPVLAIWYGQQPSGPIRVTNRLTVIGSGVAAGQLQAQFSGVIYVAPEQAPAWWPSPTPAPPPPGPFTLAQGEFFTGGTGTTVLVDAAPVTLGTAVGVFVNPGISCRLQITWIQGSGSDTFIFDLSAGSIVQGLTLINLGPVVTIEVIGAPGNSLFASVTTGLPPLNLSPMVPGMILAYANTTIPVGATPYQLPPYFGRAFLTARINAAPNSADIDFSSADYQGNILQEGNFNVGQAISNIGWSEIPGIEIALPPAINTLIFNNRTSASAQGVLSLIAMP